MEITLSYFATVTNGNLKGLNRTALQLDLERFEGKRVELLIRKVKKNRSLPQNAWYHAVIIPCIQAGPKETQGFRPTAAEVHEFLKSKFNTKMLVNEDTGEVTTFPQSTTVLSTVEFGEFCERCRAFALDFLNTSIPDPSTQTAIFSHV